MTVDEAIEVFVRGFSFTRSLAHPYPAERVDGIWVLRDAPRRRPPYRSEEYVARGIDAAEADRIARSNAQNGYRLCVVRCNGEPDRAIRAGFRQLGYRLRGTEAFMVHSLEHVAPCDGPYPVVRITSLEQACLLGTACRMSPEQQRILARNVATEPPPVRQYMALDGNAAVGWVQSIVVGHATWCSSMFVRPAYRRRGIARSLLCRMLSDDRAAGAEASVLLASHAGALLYPTVGYEQIGELYVYTPPRGTRITATGTD